MLKPSQFPLQAIKELLQIPVPSRLHLIIHSQTKSKAPRVVMH